MTCGFIVGPEGFEPTLPHLESGDTDRFVELAGATVADEVHRAANKQMIHGGRQLGFNRFARVPVSDEKTCDFCTMLASRGFAYFTEETAGMYTKYHPTCRCKVMAGGRGKNTVAGYDPEEQKRCYELNKKLEYEGYSRAQRRKALEGVPIEELGEPNSGQSGRPRNDRYADAVRMRRAIKKVRPLWDGDLEVLESMFDDTASNGLKSTVTEALTYLPKDWVEEILDNGIKAVEIEDPEVTRSFYRDRTINLDKTNGDVLTAVHELIHAMDDINPGFRDQSRKFYKLRTEGKDVELLSKITGNKRYGIAEQAYKVEDTHLPYAYKKYASGDVFEVSTIGIEYIYRDASNLKKYDNELYKHALNLLVHF